MRSLTEIVNQANSKETESLRENDFSQKYLDESTCGGTEGHKHTNTH